MDDDEGIQRSMFIEACFSFQFSVSQLQNRHLRSSRMISHNEIIIGCGAKLAKRATNILPPYCVCISVDLKTGNRNIIFRICSLDRDSSSHTVRLYQNHILIPIASVPFDEHRSQFGSVSSLKLEEDNR